MESKRNSKELKFPGMVYRIQPYQCEREDSYLRNVRAQP